MNKKHIISTTIISLILIVASSAWFYEQGLSTNRQYEAIKIMVLAKKQHECIENNNSECVKILNETLIGITAAQLERLYKSNVSLPEHKEIKEFIQFSNKINK